MVRPLTPAPESAHILFLCFFTREIHLHPGGAQRNVDRLGSNREGYSPPDMLGGFFFSLFNLRFSLGLSLGFLRSSLLALSLLPLSFYIYP